MNGFIGIIDFLKNIGVFEYYLPFVMLFALLYGLLERSKIFTEKRINVIIALSAAFFVMAYTPVGPWGVSLTQYFANFFTQGVVALVALLFVVMMIYLLVPITGREKFPGAAKYIAFFAALIGLGMFISSGGLTIFPGLGGVGAELPQIGLSPQDIVVIILIIITIIVIYWLTKSEKEVEKKESLRGWVYHGP